MRLTQFVTLILALFLFLFYQEVHAQNLKSISYCSLFNSITHKEEKVKTTAVLYFPAEGEDRVDGGSDEFFHLSRCNNRDYFAKADFSKTKNLYLIRNGLLQISDKNSPTLYLVTFTGKIALFFTPTFGHLGGFRAEFTVDNINSISSIKYKYALPDGESDAPILETGKSLKDTNTEILFSFFGRGFEDYELKKILSDDTKLIFNNKLINNDDFLKLSRNRKDGKLIDSVNVTAKNKNEWSFEGTITSVNNDGIKKIFKYVNKYLVEKNKNRKLTYSKIWEIPDLDLTLQK